jgi:hypothetical protein
VSIIKVKHDGVSKPGQILARIWMGDHNVPFRICGVLVFTPDEWRVFHRFLKDGALFKSSALIISDEEDGSSRNLPRITKRFIAEHGD